MNSETYRIPLIRWIMGCMQDEQNTGLGPILCAPILRKVDAKLLELLGSLRPEEWDVQTVSPAWKVRDVVAHLLDTALRKLSLVRDTCFVETVKIQSPQDVVALVNRLNSEGVLVYRRLSPAVLIDLMQTACDQSASFHESLDPFARASFSVSWAGEETSLNWFDTARELTERWHHQQQIRLATNRPGIMTPDLYYPVLDCFARGLPFAFKDVKAPTGAAVVLKIQGECGGQWHVMNRPTGWHLSSIRTNKPTAIVTIPQEIAWRVFTKGIDRNPAQAQIAIEGDQSLGNHVLNLTAIVA
jgi:uncharacterized protein (TIGR03083 family)